MDHCVGVEGARARERNPFQVSAEAARTDAPRGKVERATLRTVTADEVPLPFRANLKCPRYEGRHSCQRGLGTCRCHHQSLSGAPVRSHLERMSPTGAPEDAPVGDIRSRWLRTGAPDKD